MQAALLGAFIAAILTYGKFGSTNVPLIKGQIMAEEKTFETNVAVNDIVADTPKPQASRPARRDKSKVATERTTRETSAPVIAAKRRRYSEAERADIVNAIDKQIGDGATLRAAAKTAGVTEQSYYQWRKATEAPVVAGSHGDDIAYSALVELDGENQRLRTQLADKLRAENDDLRKRLRDF